MKLHLSIKLKMRSIKALDLREYFLLSKDSPGASAVHKCHVKAQSIHKVPRKNGRHPGQRVMSLISQSLRCRTLHFMWGRVIRLKLNFHAADQRNRGMRETK